MELLEPIGAAAIIAQNRRVSHFFGDFRNCKMALIENFHFLRRRVMIAI